MSDSSGASGGSGSSAGGTGGGSGSPGPQIGGPGIRLGSPFGIPIYVAPTSLGLVLLLTWAFTPQIAEAMPELGRAAFFVGLLAAVLLYGSVLLHELSHSVVARHFGIPVRRIVLQLLGGVSELEREPETPLREFLVAAAGPALSLVLAGGGLGAGVALPDNTIAAEVLILIGWLNLVVGVFNLLPGLPLDGGRVLRAAAWAVTGKPLLSTLIAAWAGRVMAIFVVLLPFLLSMLDNESPNTINIVWSAMIGLFIWFAAGASIQQAKLRQRLPTLEVRRLARRAIPVTADVPLAEALRRAYVAGARGLVVVDALGKPTGLVDEAAVSATPEHRRPWVSVASMSRSLQPGLVLSVDLSGEEMVKAIQAMPAREYLVVESNGDIYGVLSTADVERAFSGG